MAKRGDLKAWLKPKDETQENWARSYLLKKSMGMLSPNGQKKARKWPGGLGAVGFLEKLDATNAECRELLRDAKNSWKTKTQRSKSKAYTISISKAGYGIVEKLAKDNKASLKHIADLLIKEARNKIDELDSTKKQLEELKQTNIERVAFIGELVKILTEHDLLGEVKEYTYKLEESSPRPMRHLSEVFGDELLDIASDNNINNEKANINQNEPISKK